MDVYERYNRLRDEVLSAAPQDIDSITLTQLKNNYADEIDSKRKLSSIKSVAELINILEIRDILSYSNIEPYYYIVKKVLNDTSLLPLLTEYDHWLQTVQLPQLCNMYMNDHGEYNENHEEYGHLERNVCNTEVTLSNSFCNLNVLQEPTVAFSQSPEYQNLIKQTENNASTSSSQSNTPIQVFDEVNRGNTLRINTGTTDTPQQFSTNKTYPTTSRNENCVNEHVSHQLQTEDINAENKDRRLCQAVLLSVSERLGRSWRDVARFLNITEYQIDHIQLKYPSNLKEQSYEALYLGLIKYKSDKWKIHLMRALEMGRRKDLKEMVEQLILSGDCN